MKIFVSLFATLAAASSLSASSFMMESPEELIRKADAICALEVTAMQAAAADDKAIVPMTESKTKVIECFKGKAKADEALTLLSPGQSAAVKTGAKSAYVPGAPELAIGKKLLAYLKKGEGADARFTFASWDIVPEVKQNPETKAWAIYSAPNSTQSISFEEFREKVRLASQTAKPAATKSKAKK